MSMSLVDLVLSGGKYNRLSIYVFPWMVCLWEDLMRALLQLINRKDERDFQIRGYTNHAHRRSVRFDRRLDRKYLDHIWCETEEDREWEAMGGDFKDIFDLRILFGLESYDVIHEEEPWDSQEAPSSNFQEPSSSSSNFQESPNKRFKDE